MRLSIDFAQQGLFLIGKQGAGKTVAAKHIILSAIENGFNIIVLNNTENIEHICEGLMKSNEKTLLLLDDAGLNDNTAQLVASLNDKKNNIHIVVTQSNFKHYEYFENFKNNLMLRCNFLDLNDLEPLTGYIGDEGKEEKIELEFVQ